MKISSRVNILVVEDRFIVAEDLANNLRKFGYEVVGTVMTAEEAIESATRLKPDIILMDIHLKGQIDGIEAARRIKIKTGLSVVYITAHTDDKTLQRANDTDPLGFLVKPYDERQLYTTIELALIHQTAEKLKNLVSVDVTKNPNILNSKMSHVLTARRSEFDEIIGNHPTLLALLERVELVAKTDVTVHIFGENGTGKELIANAIHRISGRRDKPFIKLNCSAIPATLLESALFGHIKGSFTGASKDQMGFIENAEKGTLLLDEIGDIPPDVQVKLLRLLQSREYSRVGESTIRTADIRIITATNRNLREMIKEGKIREDFYYRIHVFPIHLPTLQDRKSDIRLLAEHFSSNCIEIFKKNVKGFTDEAIYALERYGWPGNIRELENAIKYAFVLVPDEERIEKKHFPPEILETEGSLYCKDSMISACDETLVKQLERNRILKALEESQGNRTEAAKILGYSRVTLWKKINRLCVPKEQSEQLKNIQ